MHFTFFFISISKTRYDLTWMSAFRINKSTLEKKLFITILIKQKGKIILVEF